MSEIAESHRILRQDDTGGYYSVTTGNSLHLHNTMLEAENIMKETFKKSQNIMARVNAEAEAAINGAKRKGFEKGYDTGYRDGLRTAISEAVSEKQPIADEIEALTIQLPEYCSLFSEKNELLCKAFDLAEKIIKMKLGNNNEAFFGLYSKAALHISNVEKATLKTNVMGCSAVKKDPQKFKNAIEGLSQLETVQVDGEDGLCILETPIGTIDASVNVQFERAKNIICPHD